MAITMFGSMVRASRGVLSAVAVRSSTVVTKRFLAITTEKEIEEEKTIEKSVFISQSNNIFSNLAMEDWMYRNWDFTKHHVMFLWRNDPCVVIGRHQNPWVEADTTFLEERGIPVARRNSGGGAVYHDKGNLNITFFTPRNKYHRLRNLELIVDTLQSEWNLDVEINQRQDIMLDKKFKISGTASKLGRPNAYHHCTLLVDINKDNLSRVLHQNTQKEGIKTNATSSTTSTTVNLSDVGVSMERLMTTLGWGYLASGALTNSQGGWSQVASSRGFQLISPTDGWFPGLGALQEDLERWEWVYGKTPNFEVKREVGEGLVMIVEVEKGLVGGVTLEAGLSLPVKLVTSLSGQKYSPELLEALKTQVSQQAPPIIRAHLASSHAATLTA